MPYTPGAARRPRPTAGGCTATCWTPPAPRRPAPCDVAARTATARTTCRARPARPDRARPGGAAHRRTGRRTRAGPRRRSGAMIRELRILPPLAIARFGGAPTPMDNYDAVVDPGRPLGYRHLRPAETLEVDPATGQISRTFVPDAVRLHRERPGPPGRAVPRGVGADRRRPARAGDRRAAARGPGHRWPMCAGGSQLANLKVFRRTGAMRPGQGGQRRVSPTTASHPLAGVQSNFWPGKSIPFGSVQFIRPTTDIPQHPAPLHAGPGLVYGPAARAAAGPPTTRTSATSSTTPAGQGLGTATTPTPAPDHRCPVGSTRATQPGPEPRLPGRRLRRPGRVRR